jgi:hypothetical protein
MAVIVYASIFYETCCTTTDGRRLHDTAELFIRKAYEMLPRTNSGSLE